MSKEEKTDMPVRAPGQDEIVNLLVFDENNLQIVKPNIPALLPQNRIDQMAEFILAKMDESGVTT